MKKGTKGITLIALVITIIVILILAGVTLMSLTGDNGLLSKSQDATNKHLEEEIKEQIELALIDYQSTRTKNIDYTFKQAIEKQHINYSEFSGNDEEGYKIIVTLKNNKEKLYKVDLEGLIECTDIKWKKLDDGTITDGNIELKVGDYILYDQTKDKNGNDVEIQSYTSYSESNMSPKKNNGRTSGYTEDQTFNENEYSGGWRLLDVEYGSLKLISENSVGNYTLRGKNGYIYGVEELNKIGSIYGQGKWAEKGRCVNTNDINKITGYDPNKTGNENPYGKGGLGEYGKKVTYYWKGDSYPYYQSENDNKGSLEVSHGSFYYYDGNSWKNSIKSQNATDTEIGREAITTLKNSYYWYIPYTLTTGSGSIKGITTTSDEYKLLFSDKYWLANNYINSVGTVVSYGLFNVNAFGNGYCLNNNNNTYLMSSINRVGSISFYVRPVIELLPDINIKKDGTHNGSTIESACLIE